MEPGLVEPVNRYLHNPIAAVIVNFLKKTWVTPNQVTYASIFTGLVSAYFFSQGTGFSIFQAGILLEVVLVLDCADGQLARARGCSSDWGRLLDGIAGYIIYLAILFGIMIGFGKYYTALATIGIVTVLKAIAYDYCKLSMTMMIQQGYDGNRKEIFDTCLKIEENPSPTLTLYFYYLQVQQVIFGGQWSTLSQVRENKKTDFNENALTPEQRERYRQNAGPLLVAWSWNGVDLPLFLLAVFSISGILEVCLLPLACLLAVQFMAIMIYHRAKIKGQP
ncbi:hypothetical protein UR09_02290 [Candidatus Nitromaritima sp. SCGC AAA799-A02]|nr:hypothetical protein UR09_02290 [Candidatus Nitromaritima sp. SCGC AAA799-A02]